MAEKATKRRSIEEEALAQIAAALKNDAPIAPSNLTERISSEIDSAKKAIAASERLTEKDYAIRINATSR